MNWAKERIFSLFSGMYCCRNDQKMTMVSDPAELGLMLGYEEDELRDVCDAGFLALIEQETREIWQQEMMQQLEKRGELELVVPLIRKDGTTAWFLNRGCKKEVEGQELVCGILVDFTNTKHQYDVEREAAHVLYERAQKDSLTNLYNASTSRRMAEEYLASYGNKETSALLIIDMDGFKNINDQHGHMYGDAVLVQAAQSIRKLFRSKDIVGRIGGDEFMVLMKNVPDKEIVKRRCVQVNETIHGVFAEQFSDMIPTCSIGVAFAPEHGDNYFTLFCQADQALYQAKELGRKQYVFYEEPEEETKQGKSDMRYANYDVNMLKGYLE